MDQRGTGRSHLLDRRTIPAAGDVAAQADLLALFRADRIVADAEALRRHLLGEAPWSVLGQSFGGFCTFTYLSFAPQALRQCFVTGGIPPVGSHPDEVYRSTAAAVARRCRDLDERRPRCGARSPTSRRT